MLLKLISFAFSLCTLLVTLTCLAYRYELERFGYLLASHLHERERLNLDEAFVNATFASEK